MKQMMRLICGLLAVVGVIYIEHTLNRVVSQCVLQPFVVGYMYEDETTSHGKCFCGMRQNSHVGRKPIHFLLAYK